MPKRRVPSVGLTTSGGLQNCHKLIPSLVLHMKPKKFARNTNVRRRAPIRRFRFHPHNLGGYLSIKNLSAETALVTGGTDGIGKAIARGLAAMGAEVLIVGSDPDKGAWAEHELRAAAGHDCIYFLQADLSLMRETDRLADEVIARLSKLKRLVLCAGVVRGRRIETREGVESNFAINYLSRFVLTGRLLPLLQAAGAPGAAARIVVIGGGARNGKIHYDDINLTRNFGIFTLVQQFCQANDLFVIEQARRLAGTDATLRVVTATTFKVGVVRTNIRRYFPLWMKALASLVFDPLLGQTPERIAESALCLLISPEFEGKSGLLFTQIKRFKATEPGARTRDPREGRWFWEFSERLAARARSQGQLPADGRKATGEGLDLIIDGSGACSDRV